MPPRVSSYYTRDIVAVRPNENLAHVRKLMLRYDIGRVIVVDEEYKPVGIITLSDLINALMGKYSHRPINTLTAKDVMTLEPKTITPRKSIKNAAHIMTRFNIGGLPVVNDEGTLIGIITRTDLTRAYAEHYKGAYRVGDLAREIYAKADPYHAIFHVARLAMLDPAGKVVVVDSDGKPIGIITRRDLAFANIPLETRLTRGKDRYRKLKKPDYLGRDKIVALREYLVPLARDIMTEDPITIRPDVDAAEAARIMVTNGIGSLIVVDEEGRATGLVTKREIVKAIASL